MYKKIKPYMGSYIRYTYAALWTMVGSLDHCCRDPERCALFSALPAHCAAS